ncbi:hypothetical protein T439DRAFT_58306 [Meredithblackwellia eburnea MCA 4105]
MAFSWFKTPQAQAEVKQQQRRRLQTPAGFLSKYIPRAIAKQKQFGRNVFILSTALYCVTALQLLLGFITTSGIESRKTNDRSWPLTGVWLNAALALLPPLLHRRVVESVAEAGKLKHRYDIWMYRAETLVLRDRSAEDRGEDSDELRAKRMDQAEKLVEELLGLLNGITDVPGEAAIRVATDLESGPPQSSAAALLPEVTATPVADSGKAVAAPSPAPAA